MTFDSVAADDADTPCLLVNATVTWVEKIPDDVDDPEVASDDEIADSLIRQMRLETDDDVADYDVDVSSLLVQDNGGDTDGE